MARWFFFILVILFGFGLGLFYTWRINPIDYTDADLDLLRVDFKTDYVLMVAEVYQSDNNLNEAIKYLTQLTLSESTETIREAINFAEVQGYRQQDIALMQSLLRDLEQQDDNPESDIP